MRKRFGKSALLAAAVVLAASVIFAAGAFAGSAGSNQDPLVTLSYVEKRIQEVLSSVTAQIAALQNQSGSGTGSAVFTVVEAEKGNAIYFGASTEFILRSGKATAIASPLGGLSDLTDGKDIAMGQTVPTNHHMLVPRDDGRGLNLLDKCFILIKGPYTLVR